MLFNMSDSLLLAFACEESASGAIRFPHAVQRQKETHNQEECRHTRYPNSSLSNALWVRMVVHRQKRLKSLESLIYQVSLHEPGDWSSGSSRNLGTGIVYNIIISPFIHPLTAFWRISRTKRQNFHVISLLLATKRAER